MVFVHALSAHVIRHYNDTKLLATGIHSKGTDTLLCELIAKNNCLAKYFNYKDDWKALSIEKVHWKYNYDKWNIAYRYHEYDEVVWVVGYNTRPDDEIVRLETVFHDRGVPRGVIQSVSDLRGYNCQNVDVINDMLATLDIMNTILAYMPQ